MIGALAVSLPLERAALVGLGVVVIGAIVLELIGPVTGRARQVSARRALVGLLVGAAALAAGLALDERGARLALGAGSVVGLVGVLHSWLQERRRSGDTGTPSAPQ